MQIKKFKDALTKYGTDGYCASPAKAKGLDEKDLMALASAGLMMTSTVTNTTNKKEKKQDLEFNNNNNVSKERTALVMA